MTNTELTHEAPLIHIVDDDEAIRYALAGMFRSVDLDHRTYESGDAFLAAYKSDQPGCLVIDIRMPGKSGLDVLRILKEQGSTLPVIVITGHGDTQTGVRAMKNGAFDFIEKPFSDQVLLDTVQSAIAFHINQWDEAQVREETAKMYAKLSDRERDVLSGIVDGEPNKRIAGNLNLSEKTIEYHRANIMRKMASRSLADLIKKVLLIEGH